MPRPARPWFRVYVEVLYDRKLRRLKPEHRWLFMACLAIARQSPEPGSLLVGEGDPVDERDIADMAGMDLRVVKAGMKALVQAGVLCRGTCADLPHKSSGSPSDLSRNLFTVPRWKDRQYESDDVTKRTRKHRATRPDPEDPDTDSRSREQRWNVPNPFPGTAPDTETEDRDRKGQPPVESEHRALALVPEPSSPPATARRSTGNLVRQVFDAWRESTGHPGAKLDGNRKRLIEQRLKDYPVEDLVDAVRGWQHSPHHRGDNDRHRTYNDLGLLLRNAEKVEFFRDLERDPSGRRASAGTQRGTGTESAGTFAPAEFS